MQKTDCHTRGKNNKMRCVCVRENSALTALTSPEKRSWLKHGYESKLGRGFQSMLPSKAAHDVGYLFLTHSGMFQPEHGTQRQTETRAWVSMAPASDSPRADKRTPLLGPGSAGKSDVNDMTRLASNMHKRCF